MLIKLSLTVQNSQETNSSPSFLKIKKTSYHTGWQALVQYTQPFLLKPIKLLYTR